MTVIVRGDAGEGPSFDRDAREYDGVSTRTVFAALDAYIV